MQALRPVIGVLALSLVAGCGGGSSSSSSSTATTPTPVPTASSFSLSGVVTDDAGVALSAVSVTIVDSVNANRTATTDASGRYSMTALSSAGFTVRFQRTGYNDATRAVNLTSDTALNVTLTRSVINLTGSMSGTFAYTNSATNAPVSTQVVATVTQTGTAISGTLNLPSFGWTGSFSGTLSGLQGTATYTGSLTLSALINTGSGRCNGTRSSITGTATGSTLTFPAPGQWRWNECTSTVNNLTITLSK